MPEGYIPTLYGRDTVLHAYTDFFKFIRHQVQLAVQHRHREGQLVWEHVYKAQGIEVVVTQPDWLNRNAEDIMRKAVVNAGFVNPDEASLKVHIISEAEAAKWFVMKQKYEFILVRTTFRNKMWSIHSTHHLVRGQYCNLRRWCLRR
jgi:hypothetical protein